MEKICIYGTYHLGCVTAACLADRGFEVVGLDDSDKIKKLNKGVSPIFEPGLEKLIKKGLENKNLSFTDDVKAALESTDVLWVTFDTPVDDNDNADVEYVMNKVRDTFQYIEPNTLVIISSQLPVGSTTKLQEEYDEKYPHAIPFVYIPENLRLGKAIEIFTNPNRIIVGLGENIDIENNDINIHKIEKILTSFCKNFCKNDSELVTRLRNIIWMSVESAEMTKHALNAYLATSIVFANEVAEICESVGADYKDVERGLRTDPRVGMKAYIKAGNAYAGGTLARDVRFLQDISIINTGNDSVLFIAVEESNHEHKMWVLNKLENVLELHGKTVAVLGLTYKNDTDTLRRSASIELCTALWCRGAKVKCHDPFIKELPLEYIDIFELLPSVIGAIKDADAVIIMTGHEEYKILCIDDILENMQRFIVIDPNRFLEETLGHEAMIQYYAVGGSK